MTEGAGVSSDEMSDPFDPNRPQDPWSGQAPPPPPQPWGAPQQQWGQQQPQWSGPPPYQQYGTFGPNPYESRSTTILVMGILGLVLCQLLGPVAMVMGNNLKKEAEMAGYPEPGQAKAGRICGIVATVILVLSVLLFAVVMIIGVSSGVSTTTY